MRQEIRTLSMNSQSSSCVQIFEPFTKHIDGAIIDDAEYLDLLLPMYHLYEYNSNCSATPGSFIILLERFSR